MTRVLTASASLLLAFAQAAPPPAPQSTVPATRLRTRWAAQVQRDAVLPDYPRPQMVRRDWASLNGEWTYAITAGDAPRPAAFDGRILVPFAIESQLSGASVRVLPDQRLWYRRMFMAPAIPPGGRLLLHFGAVDWEAVVYVNGREVTLHPGAYDPFTADITDAVRGGGEQELPEIWLRTAFDLPSTAFASPQLRVFHDEDASVYLNGQLVAELAGSNSGYAFVPLSAEGRAALRQGRNTLAVHVKQTRGGQFIDLGIVDVHER